MVKTQTSSADEKGSPDTAPSEPSAETTPPLQISGEDLVQALQGLESFSLVRVALAALSILHNRVIDSNMSLDPNSTESPEAK